MRERCGISQTRTEAATRKKLTLMRKARVVSSGAFMELETQHWAYLKP